FAFNGSVQGLTDTQVTHWLDPLVDAHVNGFRVRVAEVGVAVVGDIFGDLRRNIGFASGHHAGPDGGLGTEEIGCLGDDRLVTPIVVATLQPDLLTGRPFGHDIGTGAYGVAHEFH